MTKQRHKIVKITNLFSEFLNKKQCWTWVAIMARDLYAIFGRGVLASVIIMSQKLSGWKRNCNWQFGMHLNCGGGG